MKSNNPKKEEWIRGHIQICLNTPPPRYIPPDVKQLINSWRACGHTGIPWDANYCTKCGVCLNATCANCGRKNNPSDNFCAECGTKVRN